MLYEHSCVHGVNQLFECSAFELSVHGANGVHEACTLISKAASWAGTVVHTTNYMVAVMVTEMHWIKTRTIIRRIEDEMTVSKQCRECEGGGQRLNQGIGHTSLESDRGFLIYVSQTYPSMVPYLKGIHLTLDS
jgi:hypothetical protein